MMRIVYTGTRHPAEIPGVELHHLPMLESVALPLPTDLASTLEADRDRLAVFYSRNAAERVLDELAPENFAGVEVWAVGEKTAGWLETKLDRPVHSPEAQDFEGLVSELHEAVTPQTLIVSFELDGSERRLDETDLTAKIVSIATYETVTCSWDDLDGLLRRIDPRWVVFSSPRGYSAFASNLHFRPVGDSYRVAVIGPNTRDEIVELGGRVDLVPERPDLESLLKQIASV